MCRIGSNWEIITAIKTYAKYNFECLQFCYFTFYKIITLTKLPVLSKSKAEHLLKNL